MAKHTRGQRTKIMLPAIRQLIATRAISETDKDRGSLADELQEDIKKQYPNEIVPSWETIIKMISNARNQKTSPLDKPWHLGTTLDIPAEAIAAIFEVHIWLEKEKDNPSFGTAGIKEWTEFFTDNKMTTAIWPLTIREALWISKLYKVSYSLSEPEMLYLSIHKRPVLAHRPLIENPYRLWEAAKTYADYERLCEIAKVYFDTSRLDEAVRSGTIGKTKYDLFSEYKSKKDGEK